MSLARAIFPRVSMLDHADAARVSRESLRALAAVMTFLSVLAAVTVDPFLRIWVGNDIASSSAPVGEILIIGIWVNSLAIVPFALLQARGRPDLPAKFHALELVPYFAALVLGLHYAGIEGAAWAWSARVAADGVLLYWAAERLSEESAAADWRQLARGGMLVGAACVAALTIFDVPALRIAVGGPLIVASAFWGWRIAPAQARLALRRVRPRAFT
jgi:O-antigen/teichoic acid export membrane protein